MVNDNFETKFLKQGITFDDVLLIPAKSDIVPSQVELGTTLAKNIKLNVPIITSAMDTVTEAHLLNMLFLFYLFHFLFDNLLKAFH